MGTTHECLPSEPAGASHGRRAHIIVMVLLLLASYTLLLAEMGTTVTGSLTMAAGVVTLTTRICRLWTFRPVGEGCPRRAGIG